MIIVAETKLDETFKNGEFFIDNYHLWRADQTAKGGGLLVYIRSDLACDRKTKLECKTIESIFTEINFKDRKWLICGLYRPPSLNDNLFIEDFNKTFDKISEKYDNVIIIGDLNYNCLDAEKCVDKGIKTLEWGVGVGYRNRGEGWTKVLKHWNGESESEAGTGVKVDKDIKTFE
ncbi:unnamed protein product [Mytilus edulis]|uniref:Endonuclease/exonuclease/phosphatase domain-containing protein n=1 Tax=Mytilus edulis TaxID=6550 RepID=A0A8S3V657_MYTED|nr:unnamed protein product [Mytilus edulis]